MDLSLGSHHVPSDVNFSGYDDFDHDHDHDHDDGDQESFMVFQPEAGLDDADGDDEITVEQIPPRETKARGLPVNLPMFDAVGLETLFDEVDPQQMRTFVERVPEAGMWFSAIMVVVNDLTTRARDDKNLFNFSSAVHFINSDVFSRAMSDISYFLQKFSVVEGANADAVVSTLNAMAMTNPMFNDLPEKIRNAVRVSREHDNSIRVNACFEGNIF